MIKRFVRRGRLRFFFVLSESFSVSVARFTNACNTFSASKARYVFYGLAAWIQAVRGKRFAVV